MAEPGPPPPGDVALPTVVVVGGGVAGLSALWELVGSGARARMVLLEASDRLGGKISTLLVGDRPVDVGPDGFLGRRPEAAQLCRELGLGDDLVPIGASGASVWARRKRRPLPAGLVLGVPTRLGPVARSGILSPAGTLRLLRDVVAPRPDRRGPLGDRAIGPLVARKLGRQVVERLVDPMLGGIYAGTVADASAAAVFPLVLTVAQRRAGFMRALRKASGGTAVPGQGQGASGQGASGQQAVAPAFWALRGGLDRLTERLATEATRRGAEIETGQPVVGLDRRGEAGGGWTVRTPTCSLAADAVVLAVPATAAAELLAPHDADAATLLRAIEYSSVAVVTLSYPAASLKSELYGTGLLVPSGTPLPPGVPETAWSGETTHGAETGAPLVPGAATTCMVTACTFLSVKWPHLARPGELLVRASVGRAGDERFRAMGDEALAARAAAEVGALVGLVGEPQAASVTRWDQALPQYRVHHLMRVAGVEAAARRLGGLAVAGAAYRGVGIPACVASGRQAAHEVLEHVGAARGTVAGVMGGSGGATESGLR